MLALYFDIDFIKKFENRVDLNCDILLDFYNQFLKKIRGVTVVLNLDDINEVNDQIQTREFFHYLSEINPSIILNDFKKNLTQELFDNGQISKLFFVEDCDEDILQNESNYIFISNSTLKSKWSIFLSNHDYSNLSIKTDAEPNNQFVFRSWKNLNLFAHKIRNLIVFDLYVLGNKSNQKIEDNILPCLSQLIENNNSKIIDLKLFTKSLPPTKIRNVDSESLWVKENINIIVNLFGELNNKVGKLSFIKYDKTKVKEKDTEHDRFIITNYFCIEVGAGFNIFKERNGTNASTSISFKSILNNGNRNLVQQRILNLSNYCSKLPQSDKYVEGPNKFIEHFLYYPEQRLELYK